MKLQELLAYKGINLERTRLIRHNLSNGEIAAYYKSLFKISVAMYNRE